MSVDSESDSSLASTIESTAAALAINKDSLATDASWFIHSNLPTQLLISILVSLLAWVLRHGTKLNVWVGTHNSEFHINSLLD